MCNVLAPDTHTALKLVPQWSRFNCGTMKVKVNLCVSVLAPDTHCTQSVQSPVQKYTFFWTFVKFPQIFHISPGNFNIPRFLFFVDEIHKVGNPDMGSQQNPIKSSPVDGFWSLGYQNNHLDMRIFMVLLKIKIILYFL